MNEEFSMVDSLRFGWHALWPNRILLEKIIITALILTLLRALLVMPALHNVPLKIIGSIIVACAEIVVAIGFTQITLLLVDGKPAAYRDLFLPFPVIVRYIAANLVAAVVILIGFVLFVVPGIYAMLRFSMVRYAALEQDTDAFAVLSRSSQLTAGVKWRLLGFMIAIIGINILGALVFLVGLVITIPMSMLAMAHLYRTLTRRVEAAA